MILTLSDSHFYKLSWYMVFKKDDRFVKDSDIFSG